MLMGRERKEEKEKEKGVGKAGEERVSNVASS